MPYMTFETIRQTNESYNNAIAKLAKRGFKRLQRHGSGYTHYLGEHFDTYSESYNEADSVVCEIASLMNWNQPKIIVGAGLEKFGFFKLSFRAWESCESYYQNQQTYGPEEESQQEAFGSRSQKVVVHFGEMSIGFSQWTDEKKAELKKIAKTCNDRVCAEITKAIEKADKEIATWRMAMREMAKAPLGEQ